ncbi:MAG: GNAT family N-acetyltransferase [Clostridia bacterium]|nr:GNAT family N-acetyltransferase [Clostridia bacterium]
MKYKGKAQLKNGETLTLRSLCAQDAAEMIRVCKKAAGETDYMMRYEDEWIITEADQREVLAKAEHAPRALMLGAFVQGRLVGVASLRPVHPGDRARHRAGLGISILKSHWGLGIGTAMMRALIAAAKETTLEQLELDVVSTNETAIRLYERCGFAEYGRHPRMMKHRDGAYADTILMMLDLRKES